MPGGIVLTGGVANMQGVLELAQVIFQNRVRIAIPDYIGVREPQYTTCVGLIKFAYKNARLKGKKNEHFSPVHEHEEKRVQKQPQPKAKPEKQQEEKMSTKMKRFLGYLF